MKKERAARLQAAGLVLPVCKIHRMLFRKPSKSCSSMVCQMEANPRGEGWASEHGTELSLADVLASGVAPTAGKEAVEVGSLDFALRSEISVSEEDSTVTAAATVLS